MLALSLEMGGTHIGCGVVRDNDLPGSTSQDSELAGATLRAGKCPVVSSALCIFESS